MAKIMSNSLRHCWFFILVSMDAHVNLAASQNVNVIVICVSTFQLIHVQNELNFQIMNKYNFDDVVKAVNNTYIIIFCHWYFEQIMNDVVRLTNIIFPRTNRHDTTTIHDRTAH